jgi:hypothetical protein
MGWAKAERDREQLSKAMPDGDEPTASPPVKITMSGYYFTESVTVNGSAPAARIN